MSTRVILIRHAKSSWDDPMADDHARVLNARGRSAADRMGRWLAARGFVPAVALVSDAARTRETAARLWPDTTQGPDIHFDPSLYHAAPDTMLARLQEQEASSLALVGHNPGMALLARGLVAEAPAHARFADYPTCAVCVIDFSDAIRPLGGRCISFVVPDDLTA